MYKASAQAAGVPPLSHKEPWIMTTMFRSIELAELTTLSGRELLLQSPFKAGVTHVDGRYGFTQDNFLLEGANRIRALGPVDAIFVYMDPKFDQRYPQKNNGPFWPAGITSLTQLAQTTPFQTLFAMPFTIFVLTTNAFSTHDDMDRFATDPNWATLEEQEFYDVTRHLYSTHAGAGKIFILKNWEGDYRALGFGHNTEDIPPDKLDAMNIWMSARQRGIARGRADSGEPSGVGVFHAVELSRVLDYVNSGLIRLINATLPVVNADMVSYSSYDSSKPGTDPTAVRASMNTALNAIKSLAPDPLGLGDKRILISEYGMFENETGHDDDETRWRTNTILETSQAAGIFSSFYWQVFDNEAKQPDGTYFPVDCSPGDPVRPVNSQCLGLWLVRPDGTFNAAKEEVLPHYWNPSTTGVTLTGRVTNGAGGAGIANAVVAFSGGQVTTDADGDYSLPNVPVCTVQITASAPNFQPFSRNVAVSGTQNPAIDFTLTPLTAAGSISGRVNSAVDGAALSGVTISHSGGSTTSDSSGNFSFNSVPGGTREFNFQRSGWVMETLPLNVQPGIESKLFVRLATGGKLGGHVNDSSGAPVAGASVRAHGGLVVTDLTVTTNSSGVYDFGWQPVGVYHLVASAPGYGQTTGDPQATLTTGAVTTKDLVLTATPDFSITATPASQTITAGQAATFTIQINALSGFSGVVTMGITGLPADATATFTPPTLTSGSSTLIIDTDATTPAGPYVLTISGTASGLQHTSQATLTVNAATGTASGRVTNAATGAVISGAKVSYGSALATTDANGNYTLSNLPAGSLQLTASASGFLNTVQTVNIMAGSTTTANFVLITVIGTITGRVTNASTGAGLSGVTVSYTGGSAVTDASGNYQLNSVSPGTYTLTASKSGWVTNTATVSVSSGATTTANIKIATGGKIAGKVTNKSGAAISGATVKLTGGIVPTTVTVTTNSSGNYDSNWVAIGNYSVQVSKSGYTTQTKNTTASTGSTTTLNFTLQ
jgi:hypothetical protein